MFASIVIPVYQNGETLNLLYEQIKGVFLSLNKTYEIIFVNDASTDHSAKVLEKLTMQDPNVAVITHEKNRGQHQAVLEGLKRSKGSIAITMDADLQDSPACIPALIEKLADGYEAVFAGRKGHYESLLRLLTSKVFKWCLHKVSGVPKDAGMYVAMTRKMVETLLTIPMSSPFVVAMIGLTKLPIYSIPIIREKRMLGKTTYTSFLRAKIGLKTLFHTLQVKRKFSSADDQRR